MISKSIDFEKLPTQTPMYCLGNTHKVYSGFPGDYNLDVIKYGYPYEYWNKKQLYENLSASGGCFIEIGAHIGTATLPAADYFKWCYAIEPSSRNLSVLNYNISKNKVTNVTTEQLAFSDSPGTAKFYLFPDTNSAGHSLSNIIVGESAQSEDVRITTLDEHFSNVTNCALLHIDTEGFDVRVLNGGKQFIRNQKTKPVIVIEFAPKMWKLGGSKIEDFINFTKEFNYDMYSEFGEVNSPINAAALIELNNCWKDNHRAWLDIYLVPDNLILGESYSPTKPILYSK